MTGILAGIYPLVNVTITLNRSIWKCRLKWLNVLKCSVVRRVKSEKHFQLAFV